MCLVTRDTLLFFILLEACERGPHEAAVMDEAQMHVRTKHALTQNSFLARSPRARKKSNTRMKAKMKEEEASQSRYEKSVG